MRVQNFSKQLAPNVVSETSRSEIFLLSGFLKVTKKFEDFVESQITNQFHTPVFREPIRHRNN